MKHQLSKLIGLGIAISLTAASCVAPYDGAAVTTYQTGHVARSLPTGYRTEMIGGVDYYQHNGVYYRRHDRPGQYVVVDAPRGRKYERSERTLRELPRGYRTVKRNGSVYYHHGNSYYQRRGDGYVIVDIR